MPEFFLELFSEEMPAGLQKNAADQLTTLAKAIFQKFRSNDSRAECFYGPRRLAISLEIWKQTVPAISVSSRDSTRHKGPKVGSPDAARIGFINKFIPKNDPIAMFHAEQRLIIENGYYYLPEEIKTEPEMASVVATENLPGFLAKFPWPKSMRWGQGGDLTWVRPLRRITCLLDGEIIPFTVGPISTSNLTEGHRIHGPGPFIISSEATWLETLRENRVIANQADRRNMIVDGITTKASEMNLTAAPDDNLLEEVTALVEYPVPLIGKIGQNFMDLPPQVRELSMKVNQKYFALRDAGGKPAPYFAFVANLEPPDGGAAIIAGNERVLRARLSDARHFWDLDLKTPLNELLPKLDKIIFHAKIGTQGQRTERIAKLAAEIAAMLGSDQHEIEQARWAGLLCKADLVTGMVGEFPELQGIMGGYYAEKNPRGWDGALVGPAIKTHYQPKGPKDAVPSGVVAVSVALADKLDTLREFFRIGETPTGSGDPYALRRAALGVIRTILENDLRLPLRPLLNDDAGLIAFIMERLRVMLRGRGERFDVLDSVLAASNDDDLVRLMKRVHALNGMLDGEDGKNLLAAYRRAGNILVKEEARDRTTYHQDFDESLLTEMAEFAFAQEQRDVWMKTSAADGLIAREDFPAAMGRLASLRPTVDRFFDEVTVNVSDPALRRNRLQMLSQFIDRVDEIADFSKLEG